VWLDDRYGWSPWGMATGAAVGLVGGVWALRAVYRRMNRTNRPGGASPSEN
jgi:ATP synthase protein I